MAAKKTPVKTPAKTPAKKPAKAAGKTPKPPEKTAVKGAAKKAAGAKEAPAASRKDRIDSLIQSTNKKLGYEALSRASDYESSYLLRRPTGITSLDIELIGGFPASAPMVLSGPDGVGKDALLWTTAAEIQRIYGDDFAMAIYFTEFKADKMFMKNICGLQIAFSEEELAELDIIRKKNGLAPLDEEGKEYYRHQIGEIVICDSTTADKGLDFIMSAVDSNAFQLCIVNSIGFLQTEVKEDQESLEDFAQQSNEAVLLSKFAPRLALHLNRKDEAGERNETTVVLVGQVRAVREQKRGRPGVPTPDKAKYQSGAGAWALKHGKALELVLHKGSQHYDEPTKTYTGRKIQWEFSKGKLGMHEGVRGEFDYFYGIGFDRIGDLVGCCVRLGVIEVAGSWYSYTDADETKSFAVQGADKVRKQINNLGLYDVLREKCLRAANISYRWR